LFQVILDSGGVSEQVVDYTLDAKGRRIAKALDGTITEKYLYNGFLHPSVVTDKDNEPKAFFMGNMMIKVNSGADNGTYRIVRDYLGSVRAVVNIDTGEIAQRMEYDAWGNVETDTNEGFQPFGYAGGIYDADTGLTKFGFRDYDPVIGRWTTKDPIGLSGGANVYEYAMSNPVLLTDNFGLAVDQYKFTSTITGKDDIDLSFLLDPNYEFPSPPSNVRPSGVNFRWYGNWGGPGWSNGDWNSESDPVLPREGEQGFVQPIDSRDGYYYDHDIEINDCPPGDYACIREADYRLARKLMHDDDAINNIEAYSFYTVIPFFFHGGAADSLHNYFGGFNPYPYYICN